MILIAWHDHVRCKWPAREYYSHSRNSHCQVSTPLTSHFHDLLELYRGLLGSMPLVYKLDILSPPRLHLLHPEFATSNNILGLCSPWHNSTLLAGLQLSLPLLYLKMHDKLPTSAQRTYFSTPTFSSRMLSILTLRTTNLAQWKGCWPPSVISMPMIMFLRTSVHIS